MSVATLTSTIDERLAAIPRPVPLLDREATAALSARQREILDDLGLLFADGFSRLTMADIAAALGCSLRTLYGIAPSRDQLVLVVCDRNLWATGRAARAAMGPGQDLRPLDGLRRYLDVATRAISSTTAAFSTDLDAVPGGRELQAAHTAYLVAVTAALVDLAIDHGEIGPVDSLVVAHAMAGISTVFTRPDVIDTLPGSPKQACDVIVDLLLRGLTDPSAQEQP